METWIHNVTVQAHIHRYGHICEYLHPHAWIWLAWIPKKHFSMQYLSIPWCLCPMCVPATCVRRYPYPGIRGHANLSSVHKLQQTRLHAVSTSICWFGHFGPWNVFLCHNTAWPNRCQSARSSLLSPKLVRCSNPKNSFWQVWTHTKFRFGTSWQIFAGLVMLTLYVAGCWVVCVYGVCCLPSWMIQRRPPWNETGWIWIWWFNEI
jgi:hypothetical protein